jgi:regulator of sigma E protease
MQFLETLFYFVVTLGVLVFVHEFGHFIAAKLCGMRVDRFSLGFPPRAFGKQIGDTDYCVSWLPLGGYVKIAGMIDESFDTEHLSRAPEPWEFRSKPIWQRMAVISAGVLMNLLLAVAIFWAITYVQGRTVRDTTEIGYVAEGSPAATAGLRSGDKLLQINGKPVRYWDNIFQFLYVDEMGKDISMAVLRNGMEVTLSIPRSVIPDPDVQSFGIASRYTELVIQTVEPGKPADKIGLKPHDVLLSLNGVQVQFNDKKVSEIVHASAGKPLRIEWRRGSEVIGSTVVPTAEGRIGISFGLAYTGPLNRVRFSFLGALPEGINDIVAYTKLSAQQIWQIISGKRAFSQSVGGPLRIAQMATQSAELGVVAYLGFMALLSISLAVLNIIPFPALDGGHLFFLIYEWIFRREIPVKIRLGLQRIGFAILLAFMAFVVYNDIVNF